MYRIVLKIFQFISYAYIFLQAIFYLYIYVWVQFLFHWHKIIKKKYIISYICILIMNILSYIVLIKSFTF
jgi:hypothetical protein